MTPIELAWAAGLFEGEGTVRINKGTQQNRCGTLHVSVPNTDRQVVDFFQTRWPGYMASGIRSDPRHKPAWRWIVAARKAAAFLKDIRPYIVRGIVRDRIDHGLAFQADISTSPIVNRTYEYAEQQWAAYLWMRELNARGAQAEMWRGGSR